MAKTLVKYAASTALIAVLAISVVRSSSPRTTPGARGGEGGKPQIGMAAMRIKAMRSGEFSSALMNPAHAGWKAATPVSILLNHTPRIYVTDKIDPSEAPEAQVKCIRASDGTVVQVAWKDATKDQPQVRRASPADIGTGVRVIHSDSTNRFYDSAAVMVPMKRIPAANPSIQMGEKGAPVDIYFWNSVRGPAVMKASGRATTERTGKTFPAKAVYADGMWRVTFALPSLPEGTPLAFAIWDGSKGQRGGLKYYSLWYSLR